MQLPAVGQSRSVIGVSVIHVPHHSGRGFPSSGEVGCGLPPAGDYSRSILRSPCAGVHHSTTSIVAFSLRCVWTTSAMSAEKWSPPESFGERPGIDRPPGDLRLTRPLRFRALDRVDRGAVQCEPRIPAQIRALARVRHRAKGKLAVLEGHLDPGDPRRPVGSQGGDRLVPVPVEELPHASCELRFRALDVPPRRHGTQYLTGERGRAHRDEQDCQAHLSGAPRPGTGQKSVHADPDVQRAWRGGLGLSVGPDLRASADEREDRLARPVRWVGAL